MIKQAYWRKGLLLALTWGMLSAASAAMAATGSSTEEQIALWPANVQLVGSGPSGPEKVGKKGQVTQVERPYLIVHRPQKPNGTAMLVISGGGYVRIERGSESQPAAQFFADQGITTFELIYRLPQEGWSPQAPLQDGERAMRLIRANAAKYHLNTQRIGVLGFSAGGHLAGMLGAQTALLDYPAVDASDKLSARPAFAALIYPVLTFMPPYQHTHARKVMVGQHPTLAESSTYSVIPQVTRHYPPTFLAQAEDDPVSPIENSLQMYDALNAVGVPVVKHIFATGGHGWGLGKADTEEQRWPALFMHWLAAQHL